MLTYTYEHKDRSNKHIFDISFFFLLFREHFSSNLVVKLINYLITLFKYLDKIVDEVS